MFLGIMCPNSLSTQSVVVTQQDGELSSFLTDSQPVVAPILIHILEVGKSSDSNNVVPAVEGDTLGAVADDVVE